MAISKKQPHMVIDATRINDPLSERHPVKAKKLIQNPSRFVLREIAKKDEITTCYGSACYVTNIRSRSAANTYITGCDEIGVTQQVWSDAQGEKLKRQVHDYLVKREVIQIDRVMGSGDMQLTMRLYVTKPFARIALMFQDMYFEPLPGQEDLPISDIDLVTIYVPELNTQDRQIVADVKQRINYITGTDYYGEAKKSFLRQAMYYAKQRGALGLHAGSKVLRIYDQNNQIVDKGFIIFGLSGTGKTTLTIHDHLLHGQETALVRQDDVVLMMPDGYCYGTEAGFFIKTEGLDESQTLLYTAALSSDATFENIMVDEQSGAIDFGDCTLSNNGRGVLNRSAVPGIEPIIDIEKAHNLIFITRREDIVPVCARLTPQQAAAFFMLGESVETGAGDPTKRGQSKREVGTNPFIIGPEAQEGNRILSILRTNPDMQCYILNTGRVGTSLKYNTVGRNISVSLSAGIMREIARGTITWEADPFWGYEVAKAAPGLDLSGYNPADYFTLEQHQDLLNNLRQERVEWLNKFPGLDPEILHAIK